MAQQTPQTKEEWQAFVDSLQHFDATYADIGNGLMALLKDDIEYVSDRLMFALLHDDWTEGKQETVIDMLIECYKQVRAKHPDHTW